MATINGSITDISETTPVYTVQPMEVIAEEMT